VTGQWRLSAVDFDVLWREAGHGEPPYPLEIPSPGRTHQERAEIVAAVRADLAARGTGGLAEAVALLAGGDVLIDGHLVLDDYVRLVATRVADRAAMALQHQDRLIVRAMAGPRLDAALVELLPATPAAHGQSVSLPYQALTGALAGLVEQGSAWEFERALKQAGIRGQDVRWIVGMLGAGRGNGAQFGVTVRRDGGREQRLGILSWYATATGGVLIHRPPGGQWVTIAPGDPARLVSWLAEMATRP